MIPMQIKEHLKHFQTMKAADKDFAATLGGLMDQFSRHVEVENTRNLPMLENVIDSQENRALAAEFEKTKMFVPSRVHQEMSSKPPFDNVVGLLAAPLDKLTNLFRKFPKDREDKEKVYNPPDIH